MDRLMGVNPGLSSRFPTEVVFPSLEPSQCLELLRKELGKQKIAIGGWDDGNSAGFYEVLDLFQSCAKMPSWGNARDVQTLAESLSGMVFKKLARNLDAAMVVGVDDIVEQLKKMGRTRDQRDIQSPDSSRTSLLSDFWDD